MGMVLDEVYQVLVHLDAIQLYLQFGFVWSDSYKLSDKVGGVA